MGTSSRYFGNFAACSVSYFLGELMFIGYAAGAFEPARVGRQTVLSQPETARCVLRRRGTARVEKFRVSSSRQSMLRFTGAARLGILERFPVPGQLCSEILR